MDDLIRSINKLNSLGFIFWVEQEERLRYMLSQTHPEKEEALIWVKENKEKLLELLKFNTKNPETSTFPYIYKYNVDKQLLSFAQERLWFIEKYEQGTNVYNIPITCKLNKGVSIGSLERSIQAIVARHEILRTVIKEDRAGNCYQELINTEVYPLEIQKIKCISREELEESIKADISHIYDLSKEYPIRVRLYSLEDTNSKEHQLNQNDSDLSTPTQFLSIVIHHIAFDGWSSAIFLDELNKFYKHYHAAETGQTHQLKLSHLTIQYKDFALWQRNYLTGDVLAKQLSYWKSKLEGYEPLHLQTDYARPGEVDYQGKYIPFELDKDLSLRLREVAKSLSVSLYSLMLTCYYLMLRVYAGQDDIVIGSPVANRHYRQVEHLIGLFVNTLALRINLEDGLLGFHSKGKLKDFITHIGSEVLEAQLHQDLPFEKLVEELNIPKDTSRHPIFQVMFSVNSFRDSERDKSETSCSTEESAFSPHPIENEDIGNIAKFDLETFIDDKSNTSELKGGFIYRISLYKEETIKRFINTYKEILLQVAEALSDEVSKDNFKIEDLTYLTQQETDLILTQWNSTEVSYPEDKAIHKLFEEQAKKAPDKLALTYKDQHLSYGALNDRANQLSNVLRKEGIKLDSRVGISIPRGLEFVTGMLATLKAGGAYVPLDPEYPEDRLTYMLEDAGIEVLLTIRELSHLYDGYKGKIIYLDVADYQQESTSNLDLAIPSEALAYVIYTSGSTGNPKGVGVVHHALINVVLSSGEKTGLLSEDMRLYAVTSTSFDVSGLDYYLPLLSGGLVCISSIEEAKSDERSRHIITRHQVNCIQGTPSYWTLLTDKAFKPFGNLKLLSAGEPLTKQLYDKLSGVFEVHDLYGPTESTVYVTHHSVKDEVDIGSIGTPLYNTQIYILDHHLNQVPIGAIGEIYIGGVGLARGYINRPGLTAEKFIANPFGQRGGERLYKTGDLGRFLPNGHIEFLGRADHQVKLRGFRIELGEIENKISSVRGVKKVVVLIREDEPDQKRLVAYVVPESPTLLAEGEESKQQEFFTLIRKECSKSLPDYMSPSQIMMLAELPLTPNGKIDRKALPKPDEREGLESYQAPEGKIENSIASIWKELLNLERVGRGDNFFYLGGHSLIATRLISKIRQNESIEVPLRAVFEHPVLSDLAHVIEQQYQSVGVLPSITKKEHKGLVPLSFAQQRLWFIEQLLEEKTKSLYNMQTCIKIKGSLDVEALECALTYLVERHETLRTKIVIDGEHAFQLIIPPFKFELSKRDTSEDRVNEEIREIVSIPFNLEDTLFRGELLKIDNSDYVLVLTFHHIISDGWSIGVFNRELSHCYNAFARGKKPNLAPLKIQYTDYTLWQRDWFKGEVLQKQLDYWTDQLSDLPSVDLSFKAREEDNNYDADEYLFKISKPTLDQLNSLCHQEDVTLFMLLLAAFQGLLSKYINQQDVAIGTPIANRRANETEDLIGFFVNTLVVRSSVDANITFKDFLHKAKQTILNDYEHQDIPFEQLVDVLNVDRDLKKHSLFQIFFVLQNNEMTDIVFDNLDVENLIYTNIKKSIFDLALNITETDDGLYVNFEYSRHLFDKQYIQDIANKYNRYIEAILANPDTLMSNISILNKGELAQLTKLNFTSAPYPRTQMIHQLFEVTAEKSPDKIALTHENQQLSYGALNTLSNQLSHLLHKDGIKLDDRVGISAPRGLELVIGMLATLKAGAAYVPLDPEYPEDRLHYMLEDAGVDVLLTVRKFGHLYQNFKAKIIYIDDCGYTDEPKTNLDLEIPPEALAYVIYTSGSTGKPKGVACTQDAFMNRLNWGWMQNNFQPEETMCLQSSISFVDSTWDIFGSLAVGARLIMYKEDLSKSIEAVLENCSANKVTRITLVPSLLKELVIQAKENPRILKNALQIPHWEVTGEQFHTYLAKEFKQLLNRPIHFLDCYGATEATSVLYKDFTSTKGSEYTTRLLSNTQIYILDKNLNQVPVGAIGEIFIGGVSLARGYLNRPGLTAEKFIANPFGHEPGERLYRTGDLARYLPDGNLEFLGRADHQIKIRGFRIELGEIESAVNQIDGIGNAVVIVDDTSEDNKRLVAYYVANNLSSENSPQHTYTLLGKWRDMYDQLYGDDKNHEVAIFDIAGWNSSYTRLPFSVSEMEEWRDSTVDRITSLNPRTILEIGSGTGLLTYPLVKSCESYIGADFSSVAVQKLDHGLRTLDVQNASILLAKADDVFEVKAVRGKPIDTIILNSITQYFPSAEYLDNVLKRSIEVLNQGKIFIGDIRDFRLLDVLHFSIEAYKIREDASDVDVSTLQNSIKMQVKKETELLLSPSYFFDLAKRNPKIEMIEILPKRGVYDNELNGFRYDVIIHVHQRDTSKVQLGLAEEKKDILVFEYENHLSVRDILISDHSSFIIKGYPNKRVWKDYQLKQELDSLEPSEIYYQDERYIGQSDSILSLEELHSAAKQEGYSLYSHLAVEHEDSPSKFDLYFYKDQSELDTHKKRIFRNYLDGFYQSKLSNNPEVNDQRRSVDVAKVREILANNLPEYMVPSLFIELAEMPLSPNGKLDRKALPKPDGRDGLAAYQAPEGLIENSLAAIWKELLQVEKVGRGDNFFHLGGHSLIATRLISKIRQSESVEVPLRVIFDHPVLSELAEVIEQEYQSVGVLPPITRVKRSGLLPLSFAQQRLWFIEQLLEDNNGLYHIPTVLQIKGNLNENALKQALNYLISRHEILRTRLVTIDGEGYQEIMDEGTRFPLSFKDLRKSKDKDIDSLVLQEISRRFANDNPLCRALCLKVSEQERVLVITFHHMISDGWSVGIFNKEFSVAYESFACFSSPTLPELPVQYADYSMWQRSWLSGNVLEKQLNYWQEQLQDISSLELPADRSRPSVQSYRGGYCRHYISKEKVEKLRQLSKDEGVTLFMVLFSIFSGVLSKLCYQNDIVIGTPIAGRNSSDVEGLIGFFVNTLALRVDTTGNPNFKELLHRVEKATLGAYEHQDVPFEQLVDHLNVPRDLNRHPLFQVMFVLQNVETTDISMGDLELKYEYNDEERRAKFDLTLNVEESPEGLCLGFEYAKDLFDEHRIKRLAAYYDQFLIEVITDAEQKLSEIPILDRTELTKLSSFNSTEVSYPEDKAIHKLFEEQAKKAPDKLALTYKDQHLSYGALNDRANQLSNVLRKEGIKLDSRVGISIPRGLEFVTGMLATLKAGGAYVPLDPEYPEDRLTYMLEDAGIEVLLTIRELSHLYDGYKGKIIYLDVADYQQESTSNLDLAIPSEALAYVIYTSGSTGNPKGVGVVHHALINVVLSSGEKTGLLSEDMRLYAVTSTSFDVSGLDYYLPLLSGGLVCISSIEEAKSDERSRHIITRHQVNCIQGTPSYWTLLTDKAFKPFGNLKLLSAGEPLTKQLYDKLSGVFEVHDLYGPTESTVYVTHHSVKDEVDIGSIGTPLYNTQIYILDHHLNQVPIGAIGEIYIGGVGLARGYINRPGLTAEKFIANPFGQRGGERLYKTGDLGRFLPNGHIEFLGRADHQVKLRGFRIELGEIENKISSVRGVKKVVVLIREDEPDQKRLVAYVVPESPTLLAEGEESKQQEFFTLIRKECSKSLPDYMSPSQIMMLAELPLTPNGKIDRKALPKPDEREGLESYQAPEGKIENSIASIWKELLNLERVGRGDNFFYLGGHSLIATRLISKIRQNESIEVPLRAVFEHPVLSDLAHVIEQQYQSVGVLPSITKKEHKGLVPLSFAQQRLWFIEKYEQGTNAYNIPMICKISKTASLNCIEKSIKAIIARHEVLRTVIKEGRAGSYYQELIDTEAYPLEIQKVKCISKEELDESIKRDVTHIYDLSKEYPIRVRIYSSEDTNGKEEKQNNPDLSASNRFFSIVIHHIAFDGWSTDIFMEELNEYYKHYLTEKSGHTYQLKLPPLTVQYKDFALWQRNYLTGNVLEKQLSYWKSKLEGYETLNFPTDYTRPSELDYEGRNISFELDRALSLRLREVAKSLSVSLYSLMLTCYYLMLRVYARQDDIVIGSPVANRHYSQVEHLIGFFVNTLALRINVEDDLIDSHSKGNLRDFIKHVGSEVLDAQLHQDLPFEKLVEELGIPKDTSRHPIFQVMFSLQSFGSEEKEKVRNSQLEQESIITPYISENKDTVSIAKFDIETFIDDGCSSGVLKGSFNYRLNLYKEDTIKRFIDTYKEILSQVAEALTNNDSKDNFRIADLIYLTQKEKELILKRWNNTDVSYPRDETIHQLFEEQVERDPDSIALLYENKQLSYGALNSLSNQLSHILYKEGVALDSLVGISVPRGLEFVIGMLAILKAGGAYLPLDPNYPEYRLNYMLEDAGVDILLTVRELGNLYQNYKGKIIYLDDYNYLTELTTNLSLTVPSDALAYVIYTSGSTGKPKGVGVTQGSIINHMQWIIDKYFDHFTPYILQRTNPNFDASVWEIFLPLLVKGKMVIATDQSLKNPEEIKKICSTHMVNTIQLVPALIDMFEQEGSSHNSKLRKVFVGGDRLTSKHIKIIRKMNPECQVYNLYGPTESTIDASSYKVLDISEEIPIGTPIANTQLHILDKNLKQVPIGSIGEIFIGGVGLARGYLNRAGLTAEKFIPNPFSHKSGERLFKTGDLARYLPDGNIEFMGRVDHQVKIRGFRIELGEIESVLSLYPGVTQCVVLAKEHSVARIEDNDSSSSTSKYIAAYYTTDTGSKIDEAALISQLSSRLPDYMVPSILIHIEKMPLSVNGKLDRKSLPEPEFGGDADSYAAPRNETELQVCAIWEEVLGLPSNSVGIHDDFFKMGGDSIVSIQLVNKIRKQLTLETNALNVKDIFSYRTIEKLYNNVIEKNINKVPNDSEKDFISEQGVLSGEVPLLPIQRWFFDSDFAVPQHWNQSFLVHTPELDIDILKSCIKVLLEHHDAFRLEYNKINRNDRKEDENPSYTQYYSGQVHKDFETLKVLNVRKLRYRENTEDFNKELFDKLTSWQSNFSIENGPRYTIGYINGYNDGSARIFFALHHLIVDAVSWRILVEDLKELYNRAIKGKSIKSLSLGPKGLSYRQWVTAVANYGIANNNERVYWEEVISDIDASKSILEEKVEYNRKMVHNEASSSIGSLSIPYTSCNIFLSEELTTKLLKKSHMAYHTEVNDLLLSALSLTLSEVFGNTVNHITLEGHGRHEDILDKHNSLDLSKTVGWFTTMYPVRLEVGRNRQRKADTRNTIMLTKELLRQVPHKGVGFGSLLGYKDSQLPKISFNYLGQINQLTRRYKNNKDAYWYITSEPSGLSISNINQDRNIININGAIIDGELRFNIASKLGTQYTDVLANTLKRKLEEVVYHTTSLSRTYLTRSDIGNIISEDYLNRLQRDKEVEAIYAANSLQQGFIYHYLNQGDVDDAYIVQIIWQYKNKLDLNKLKEAWQSAQNKYPTLRLRLHWDEELVQVIDGIKNVEIDWRYINLYKEQSNREDDVSTISSPEWEQIEASQELKIKQIQEEDRKERYKLEEGNLFRIYIIKQYEDLYTCILSSHHAILDGWSNPILFDYVHQTYLKLTQGKIIDPTWFAEDSIYLNAQKYLQDHQKNNDDWWRKYLSKIEGQLSSTDLLSLTTKSNEKNGSSFNLKDALNSHKRVEEPCSETLVIKGEIYEKLKCLSKKEGITLSVLLQYAWHKALKVYGSNNIESSSFTTTVVGTVLSGRNLPIDDIDTSVGLYINTLPLLVEHGIGTYLLDDIKKLQNDLTEINTRSNVNLPNLHKNGTRLFDTVFIFENYPIPTRRDNTESISSNINNEHIEELNIEFKKAIEKLDYPIAVFAYETTQSQSLTFSIKYAGEMFHKEVIEQLLHVTKTLLSQVAEGLTKEETKENFRIEDLTYLTQKEKELILTQWNNTEVSHPRDTTIHQLFEEQAEIAPDKIALTYENKHLSYATLNSLSNQLSHLLYKKGIKLESRVGISAPRELELVTSILAVMKAGGAYVPLDPEYPKERLKYMLEDAGIEVLLTVRKLSSLYNKYKGKIIYIDDYDYREEPTSNLTLPVAPESLACVIYTSGSIGNPKGTLIPHSIMLNRFQWMWSKYPFSEREIACHKTSLNFVDSIWELFGPLLKGVKVVFINSEILSDPEAFSKYLDENIVTRLVVVPSLLETLLSDDSYREQIKLKHLKLCTVSGEALPSSLISKYANNFQDLTTLINLYGSTEIGADATCYEVPLVGSEIPCSPNSIIGSPIDNIRTYILDSQLNPLPIGVRGEIYVGGDGLARGYLNKPALTAEKFIANPFSITPGERLYRTGDLGKYLPDGNIEFLGRADHQVKIRGFRIELGEIESAISSVNGVAQVVVLAREDEPGQKRLVAYVMANKIALCKGEEEEYLKGLSLDIKNVCSEHLPDYMRPNQTILLKKMPLTPNGKIDRKALPKPEGREGFEEYQEPQGIIENSIATVWKELLQVKKVGRNDNFFHLGGNSLLLVKVIYMIKKLLNLKVNIKDIFHAESLADLAQVISSYQRGETRLENVTLDINKTNKKPMFLVHPIGGLSIPYIPLKQFFPENHIIGINDPYFGFESSGFSNLMEMSFHYVNAIIPHYDLNNCTLGGWSFGGEIAFRMACQLELENKSISRLILFDSFTSEVHKQLEKENENLSSQHNQDYFFKQSMCRNSVLRKHEYLPSFNGKVYLFKCIAYDSNLSKVNKNIMSQSKYNGWDSYCKNINMIEVDLTHEQMFEEKYMHILAQHLKDVV